MTSATTTLPARSAHPRAGLLVENLVLRTLEEITLRRWGMQR